MKKILAIVLAAVILVGLIGCGARALFGGKGSKATTADAGIIKGIQIEEIIPEKIEVETIEVKPILVETWDGITSVWK